MLFLVMFYIVSLIFIRYQEIFSLTELPLKIKYRTRTIFAISFAIKYLAISILIYRYLILKVQLNKIKKETIKIKDEELNYLALQANQHLIYNSLNMLYSKANNKSPYIGGLIMNLSKQIRKII